MNHYHRFYIRVLTTEAVIAEHKLTIYPDYLPLTVMLTHRIAETQKNTP